MRLSPKPRWLVPALLASACGPTASDSEPSPTLGALAQGVLDAPPAPASGNILDSTAYLGPVAIGGAVQTQFTTNPQYLSFSFDAVAGTQVKLEVTHLGSSMYLDTGLFVYGPKDASGSYGTTVLAQDDDAGYGQLSKVASLSLPTGGEYLVVVSTGTGAGKQFRLQLDCLNGACLPPSNDPLTLSLTPVSAGLQAQVDAGNTACGYFCSGNLTAYGFPWTSAAQPSITKAAEALAMQYEFQDLGHYDGPLASNVTELQQSLGVEFGGLYDDLLAEYGNGTEQVQVARYSTVRLTAPDVHTYYDVYVLLFPESHHVLGFRLNHTVDY